jgi:ABC-type phosphate transport system substrate-binding protein
MKRIYSLHTVFLHGILVAGMLLGMSSFVCADIAMITHPKNPVRAISSEDIARIFSGTLRTFPSTGMAATALDHPASSDIYERFYRLVLKTSPDIMKRRRASYLFSGQGIIPESFENDAAIKQQIAKRPSAIGYVDVDAVDKTVKVIFLLREPLQGTGDPKSKD